MSKLLRALLGMLFVCSIVGGEGGPGDEGDEGPGDDDDGGVEDDATGGGEEDDGAGEDDGSEGDSTAANMRNLRQKATAAEALARQEREARIAAEARAQALEAGRRAPAEDELPADADQTQRFVHEGNKQLKRMAETVTNAQFESRDAADTARFYAKSAKNPDILKMEDRIEKEVQRLRTSGQFVPREAIMTFMLGQDVMAARARKAASGGKQSKVAEEAGKRVEKARGEPTRPRSDKGGKERLSESDKRKERLKNQYI